MTDVTKSKWLQGMRANLSQKKKEAMKKDIKTTVIMLVIGVVIMVIAKIAKSALGILGLLIALLAILLEIILLLIRISGSTGALEKRMKKVLTTDDLLRQFDNEILGTPTAVVPISGGRVIFTEHFAMSQYESPAWYRFSSILLLDNMAEMDTTVYKTNGQVNGIVTRFYKTGEKKACQAIEFKVDKDSNAFLSKLTEIKPEIRAHKG